MLRFLKKLLTEIGYGLQLEYEVISGAKLIADKYYYFDPEIGFTLSEQSASASLFLGSSLIALSNENLVNADCLRDAKRLMRLVLAPLLGTHPLQSRKLFIEVEVE